MRYEDERKCAELSIMNDKIRPTMLEETMNCLSILPIESDVTKIVVHCRGDRRVSSRKTGGGKCIKELCQSL